jgi:hypothetical protein
MKIRQYINKLKHTNQQQEIRVGQEEQQNTTLLSYSNNMRKTEGINFNFTTILTRFKLELKHLYYTDNCLERTEFSNLRDSIEKLDNGHMMNKTCLIKI